MSSDFCVALHNTEYVIRTKHFRDTVPNDIAEYLRGSPQPENMSTATLSPLEYYSLPHQHQATTILKPHNPCQQASGSKSFHSVQLECHLCDSGGTLLPAVCMLRPSSWVLWFDCCW